MPRQPTRYGGRDDTELVIVLDCADLDRANLRTADMEDEVARLVDLGAVRPTSEPIHEDGMKWHALAGPDGNEFCVVQPLSDDA